MYLAGDISTYSKPPIVTKLGVKHNLGTKLGSSSHGGKWEGSLWSECMVKHIGLQLHRKSYGNINFKLLKRTNAWLYETSRNGESPWCLMCASKGWCQWKNTQLSLNILLLANQRTHADELLLYTPNSSHMKLEKNWKSIPCRCPGCLGHGKCSNLVWEPDFRWRSRQMCIFYYLPRQKLLLYTSNSSNLMNIFGLK